MEHSHLDKPLIQTSLRVCLARVSRACIDRGGHLEPGRQANARYCRDCATLVRREQSRLGKKKLRHNPVYRRNQREYKKHRSTEHAVYMRGWRKRRKQKADQVHQQAA